METFAAGILPYIVVENNYYFLLGLEKSNNLWSGFVGGSNKNELITDTALREFNEESVFIFEEYIPFIKSELLKTQPQIDITGTGKEVYIWFIQLPEESQECIKNFINNKSKFEEEHFHEKSILRWFTIDEIKKSNKIFYKLKKVLVSIFC